MKHPWLIVLYPFALGFLIVVGIIGLEAWAKHREKKALRVRDENMRKYGFAPFKDRFLS